MRTRQDKLCFARRAKRGFGVRVVLAFGAPHPEALLHCELEKLGSYHILTELRNKAIIDESEMAIPPSTCSIMACTPGDGKPLGQISCVGHARAKSRALIFRPVRPPFPPEMELLNMSIRPPNPSRDARKPGLLCDFN